jgi:drug/metabolite transporter (DMT)-like permease
MFLFGTLLFYFIRQEKTNILVEVSSLGWMEWTAALLWGISNLTLKIGFQNTNIATVLVINSSNSLFAALGSYWFLKEELKYRTIFTIVACFGALVFICYAELAEAHPNVLGLLCSLVSSATLGAYLVLLRYIEKTKGLVIFILFSALVCLNYNNYLAKNLTPVSAIAFPLSL